LRRADPPYEESYRLSIIFIISELILNGNRPESLIRQGRRRKRKRRRRKKKKKRKKRRKKRKKKKKNLEPVIYVFTFWKMALPLRPT
jgi:mannitol-specific phosphotransferase system IIBC component